MGNPVIRKRTIQHPGFEFFETDMSIYKEYVQDNDALIVGFFSRGPVMTPVSIKNLNDYSVYFGTPESEAEIYFYKGIEAVLDAGGTVTALRLPYDNTTCGITEAGPEPQYRALKGNFVNSTIFPEDINLAYEGGTTFKNIEFKPAIIDQKDITEIVGGTSADDFVIVNKYNDVLTPRGEEIFVTVLGAGNAIREQGLDVDAAMFGEEHDYVGASIAKTPVHLMAPLVLASDLENVGDVLVSRERIKWESNGELAEDGTMLTVADSFAETLPTWFPTLPTYMGAGDEVFVDPRKDDIITVVVSKIKPSVLESGKSNIVILETFSGSIFKGSVDQISNESNYIGDIINGSSNFISFYGKPEYKVRTSVNEEGKEIEISVGFDMEEDTILVSEQLPLRFSWKEGAETSIKSCEYVTTVNEYNGEEHSHYVIELNETSSKISLKKSILKKDSPIADYVKSVIRPALKKVANNIKYVYRDVYDCGLSSVIAFRDEDGIYNPTKTDPNETTSPSFLRASLWKKVVLEFARHCQFKHKLSMFHADSPRKLVLNGNLSRTDDLFQDQDTVVFTPKKIQTISIKDNTYMSQNAQWYEVADEFNKTMMWIPNSIRLAGDITTNDTTGNVWDAPAGHRYGVVKNVARVAFNPEQEIQDRLYSNCINYAVAWPDGVTTIEGQKTAYSEISTLNRVNARRLLIWLERWSQKVSADYIYEPNTSEVREKFVAALEEEFKRCFTLGGLYGYRIVCDETNNPGEVIDRNELRVAIMVQITKTVEFILANFIIAKTGVNLEEISPVF